MKTDTKLLVDHLIADIEERHRATIACRGRVRRLAYDAASVFFFAGRVLRRWSLR